MGKLNRPESPLCACGCLQHVTWNKQKKRWNMYLNGHNTRGKHLSEETIQEIRGPRGPMSEEGKINIRMAKNNPETRKKWMQSQKIAHGDPNVTKKKSEAQTKLWQDPVYRESQSKKMRKPKSEQGRANIRLAQNQPETKKKKSASIKITQTKLRQDPVYKERQTKLQQEGLDRPEVKLKIRQSQTIAHNQPEVKERASQLQKINWSDPEYRERQSQAIKTSHNQPEFKKIIAQIQTQLWQDLEYREKQLAAIGKGLDIKPNKSESGLFDLLQALYADHYRYSGDYSFWINGKNPDFININGQKKIIELFGDYWHKGEDPQDRIDIFTPYGYDTLVIWEHELKDIEKLKVKIIEFHEKIQTKPAKDPQMEKYDDYWIDYEGCPPLCTMDEYDSYWIGS